MIIKQDYNITRTEREKKNGHKAFVIWLTGLSGSGKSTIANLLEQHFHGSGLSSYVLDGDNIRHGLNKDLDFSKEGRKENIRRVAEVARLLCDAGIITITAFISPYLADRETAKQIIGKDSFIEVFVDASLQSCINRDIKGLYAKAQEGLIPNFTGISDVYEAPVEPAIHLHTDVEKPFESVEKLISWLKQRNFIP